MIGRVFNLFNFSHEVHNLFFSFMKKKALYLLFRKYNSIYSLSVFSLQLDIKIDFYDVYVFENFRNWNQEDVAELKDRKERSEFSPCCTSQLIKA